MTTISGYTQTQAGQAIIINDRIYTIEDPRWGTNGSIGLGILLNRDNTPQCYCLFWQWGGDWNVFEDGAQTDAELIDAWMPQAVLNAVEEAISICPACEEDMDWFVDWANTAQATIDGEFDD